MIYYLYFLIRDMRIVYIGHTRNLYSRFKSHTNKNYNAVRLIKCATKSQVLFYEKRWQLRFKPEYNLNGTQEPSETVMYHFRTKSEVKDLKKEAKGQFRTLASYLRMLIITHPDRNKK